MKNRVFNEFNSVKKLISYVLENHIETRSSDNKLFVKCAEYLGARTLSDLEDIGLSIITIHKTRQKLNRDGLFLPNADVVEARKERSKHVQEYMVI